MGVGEGHSDAVNAVAIYPDGLGCASASRDGTIRWVARYCSANNSVGSTLCNNIYFHQQK